MVVLDRFSRAVQGLDMRHGSVGKRESVVVQLHNRCGGKLHEMAPTLQPVTVTVRLLEDGEGHNVRPVVAAAAFVKPRKANGIFISVVKLSIFFARTIKFSSNRP